MTQTTNIRQNSPEVISYVSKLQTDCGKTIRKLKMLQITRKNGAHSDVTP